ncbi:PSD1 and planctomycete cytochrome C domain-containing protein [Thalassoglobus sp. JC818]|uniref:PSD1 and planctomycete cytochrome C domain-containing protein n=1 Tax=Thalassoglobus sp. JC818 TaxID=3232136 RepID=UPI003458318A
MCCLSAVLLTLQSVQAEDQNFSAAELEFFEKKVRPILAEHCYSCHSVDAKKIQASLLVDSRSALLTGGDSGEAILPGDPDSSLLIEAVKYESYEMPPKGKLSSDDIQALEDWVRMGAPWPDEEAPTAAAATPKFDLESRRSEHWVWHPIRNPAIPEVQHESWPNNSIDHFILAQLEDADLQPTGDANRSALIRRLYFDLIGLPPTPDEVAAFVEDSSPQAVEDLVDKLLASPHFGERWGRHWLDLVRYAESRGHEFDNDAPNAFQYRDYIIRALNSDVPHDQLIREHIAGDLLPNPRLNAEKGFNESILGTGFWFLGEWVHSPVDIRKDESDRFDNMIDVMSKAFLGMTVSCARCHDHKFDAISTADYYSLSGFLESSDYRQVRFESLEHNRTVAVKLAQLDAEYQAKISAELSKRNVATQRSKPVDESLRQLVVIDYGTVSTPEYLQDGFIFAAQPKRAGEFYWSDEGGELSLRLCTEDAAISDPIWNQLESVWEKGVHNKSRLVSFPRSGRTLRTPTFTVTDGDVACRVRGEGHVVACVDSHRLIAGPLHGETISKIHPGSEWTQLNLQRYVGHRIHLEFTPSEGTQLQVSLVTQGATPEQREELSRRVEAQLTEEQTKAVDSFLEGDGSDLVAEWKAERERLQTQIMNRSQLAMAMMDGTGEDGKILIRGNSSNPGDHVPRHFLTAVAGEEVMEISVGSGRLELAEKINAADNPLTARVAVNRIWHFLMGRGIVPTTDDFGVLGERPTHPELLDHLAVKFVNDGRSIKKMIREIVLSRVYQLDCVPVAESLQADPKNLLWHYRPPKRLEGEVIRDAILSMSGRLDPTLYGEPVPIHLTPFMDGRGRPGSSGPLDGDGRRSIYVAVRRNFLSPFMLTFDTPAPFSTMGRRNVSNVPAQSLILMNDPFVVEQSKMWAARAMQENDSMDSRLEWLYQTAFSRSPTANEAAVAMEFLTASNTSSGDANAERTAWEDLAHALMNTKEFIFLR